MILNYKDLKPFIGKWVHKKSKMPIGPSKYSKPAIFITGFKIIRGKLLLSSKEHKKLIPIVVGKSSPEFTIITEEEANFLNKTYKDSSEITESPIGEGLCHREDNKQKKVCFNQKNFQKPLYNLKLKFPDYDCSAYQCRYCSNIHLGKLPKNFQKMLDE